MSIKALASEIALAAVARWITSPQAWEQVRDLVRQAGALDIDPDERRRIVITEAKRIGWRWADWALNLVIEIAVAIIERKLKKSVV